MATMERMALGAHNSQGPVLTEQPAHKRKLNDRPLEHTPSEYLGASESYDSGKFDENSALSDDMPMSETKRRAQNRAAQRAFRERKERHLRELEKRLLELESESRSWKSTNLVLRSQLSLLEEQLNHYRNPNQAAGARPPPPAPLSMSSTSIANSDVISPRSGHSVPTPGAPGVQHHLVSNSSHYSPHSGVSPHNALDSHPDPSMLVATPYGNAPAMGLPPNHTQTNMYAGPMAPSPHYNETIPGMGPSYSHVSPSAIPSQHSPSQLPSESQSYHIPSHLHTGYRDPMAQNLAVDPASHLPNLEKPPSLLSGESGSPSHYADQSSKNSPDTPSRAEVFCEKLSMACGMHRPTPPANAPKIAAEVSGWQTTPKASDSDLTANWVMQNGNWSANYQNGYANSPPAEKQTPHRPIVTPQPAPSRKPSDSQRVSDNRPVSPDEIFNFDFGNMASGFGEFNFGSQPSKENGFVDSNGMDNLLNNDFGVFDPLDNLLSWDQPKEQSSGELNVSQPAPSAKHTSVIDGQAQDPLMMYSQNGTMPEFDANHLAGSFLPDSQPVPNQTDFNPSPVKGTDTSDSEEKRSSVVVGEVPAASQKFIPCADVWDRICSHPRFGEIDINSMCQELRNKARCSKMGVVLDEEDVDSVLKALR